MYTLGGFSSFSYLFVGGWGSQGLETLAPFCVFYCSFIVFLVQRTVSENMVCVAAALRLRCVALQLRCVALRLRCGRNAAELGVKEHVFPAEIQCFCLRGYKFIYFSNVFSRLVICNDLQ